ncbi:hypothetical protein [Bradyrhizobium sp.]|uniref:hypothetical protein n=1 Tax=Bradyrhizobium sp. TaxID=376 RepID=UPI002D5EC0D2|nr:hypothetical protein [Bradyrhizobium sp.]HZR73734.1 hypothetical protein [Bradyrhizobium sp.]
MVTSSKGASNHEAAYILGMQVQRLTDQPRDILPYDPGTLPTRPAPKAGDVIRIEVDGLPPAKTIRRSIRNENHPKYESFVLLRRKATAAMAGRAWVFGPVAVNITLFGPSNDGSSMVDYLGGVMDTLDGSSGPTFTYLPIVFEDDCQVVRSEVKLQDHPTSKYLIEVEVL